MYKELNEIADVISGYTFRGAIKPDSNGEIFVLQAKDIVQGKPINNEHSLTRVSHNLPGYTGYLKKNDILLVSRGMKSGTFRSAIFMSEVLNVIASSSVYVIRLIPADILPEYISHYLNSREGQETLSRIVSGSHIGVLPRKELEKISIPVPPLDAQRAIVGLYHNIQEQKRIVDRQNQIKREFVDAIFKNITEEKGTYDHT